jgi:hypothetical protein
LDGGIECRVISVCVSREAVIADYKLLAGKEPLIVEPLPSNEPVIDKREVEQSVFETVNDLKKQGIDSCIEQRRVDLNQQYEERLKREIAIEQSKGVPIFDPSVPPAPTPFPNKSPKENLERLEREIADAKTSATVGMFGYDRNKKKDTPSEVKIELTIGKSTDVTEEESLNHFYAITRKSSIGEKNYCLCEMTVNEDRKMDCEIIAEGGTEAEIQRVVHGDRYETGLNGTVPR